MARKALWSLRRRVFRLAHREPESQLLRASRDTRPENCIGFGARESPLGEGKGGVGEMRLWLPVLMITLQKAGLFPPEPCPLRDLLGLCIGHTGV